MFAYAGSPSTYEPPGCTWRTTPRLSRRNVTLVHPVLGLWYHQDLYRLSPGDGLDGQLKERYSELTGLPILRITGGTYTGVAATWQRNTVGGISFIVELGPTLTPAEADTHAAAVLDIAALAVAASG